MKQSNTCTIALNSDQNVALRPIVDWNNARSSPRCVKLSDDIRASTLAIDALSWTVTSCCNCSILSVSVPFASASHRRMPVQRTHHMASVAILRALMVRLYWRALSTWSTLPRAITSLSIRMSCRLALPYHFPMTAIYVIAVHKAPRHSTTGFMWFLRRGLLQISNSLAYLAWSPVMVAEGWVASSELGSYSRASTAPRLVPCQDIDVTSSDSNKRSRGQWWVAF